MAEYHGKEGHFMIDAHDLSTYLTDISIDEPVDVAETSTMGLDAKTYVEGLSGGTISIAGVWDDTATTGPDAVLSGLKGAGANPFLLGPAGDAAGKVRYGGSAILTSYARTVPIGGAVAFTAGFQITGPVTRDVFA